MIIRFPPVDLRADPTPKPSLWRRFVNWLKPPPKAEVFKFRNPTQWKLDRIRKRARSTL